MDIHILDFLRCFASSSAVKIFVILLMASADDPLIPNVTKYFTKCKYFLAASAGIRDNEQAAGAPGKIAVLLGILSVYSSPSH
jgi:hypothetical protein